MPATFTPLTFRFLTELAANNEKPWFDANKDRYLREVRDRMLGFISDLQEPIAKLRPRGFDERHPLIEDLKRKDYALGLPLADGDLTGPKALATVVAGYRRMAPFMRFVCKALGLRY